VRVLGNRRDRIWLGHPEAPVPVDVARVPVDAVDSVVSPGRDRLIDVFTKRPDSDDHEAIASIAVPAGHCAWLRMDDDGVAAVYAAGSTRREAGGPVACGTPWDAAVEAAARCGEAGDDCRSRSLRTALELCIAVTGDPLTAECASLVAQLASAPRPRTPTSERR
jgi:hypothetical protein